MGQPAARATQDTAGHLGPIQTGSPNVSIGGFPAAREGDSYICSNPLHVGYGVIVKGSKSVMINGMACAREGDVTYCSCPVPPPPVISEPSSDQLFGFSLVMALNSIANAISNLSSNPNLLNTSVTHTDMTGDGILDRTDVKGTVFTLPAKNGSIDLLNTDSHFGVYDSIGLKGEDLSLSASIFRLNVTESLGNPDILAVNPEINLVIGKGELNIKVVEYTGGPENQFGAVVGGNAGVIAGRATIGTELETQLFDLKLKGGLQAGLAIGGGSEIFYDVDDKFFFIAVNGQIAALLGWKVDVGLKIYTGKIGSVMSGVYNVLIGDK